MRASSCLSSIARLSVAHLFAALTCGLAVSMISAVERLLAIWRICTDACGGAVWGAVPLTVLSAVMMTVLAAGVAAFAMIPATVLLSPGALLVSSRFSPPLTVAAGAAAGVIIGLPVTMVSMSIMAEPGFSVGEVARVYVSALPVYGSAAFLSGAAFAASLVRANRRRFKRP